MLRLRPPTPALAMEVAFVVVVGRIDVMADAVVFVLSAPKDIVMAEAVEIGFSIVMAEAVVFVIVIGCNGRNK